MKKKLISLEPETLTKLRILAAKEGKNLNLYIREVLEAHVKTVYSLD
jgi:predicted DNA-binding protein